VTGARRAGAALVLSLGVYLTPLVGPHAAWLLGERLWREVSRGAAGRGPQDPWWIATDVAVALAAQLALLALAWWFLGRPGWRRGLVAAAPLAPGIVALNALYMVAIPARFLIEADTAPERRAWSVACRAPGVAMPAVTGPISGAGGRAIWVLDPKPPNRYGILDASTCAIRWLAIAQSGMSDVTYTAGGHAIHRTMTPPAGRQEWAAVDLEAGTRTPLDVDRDQVPILSGDGRWAGWLRPVAGLAPPIQLEARLRAIDGGRERVVPLAAVGAGSLQLVELDVDAGALVVARGLRDLVVVGLDGAIRETLPVPADVALQPQTYRLLAERLGGAPAGPEASAARRWVTWDAYREDGPYRVAWSTTAGTGTHHVPKGRSVTALAPSPDGRWIAVSVTTTLSIGSAPDAVYVVRAADGTEAFRRYLPRYARAGVAFASHGRFVYSDLDGVNVLAAE